MISKAQTVKNKKAQLQSAFRGLLEAAYEIETDYVDPLDAYRDEQTGELWLPVGYESYTSIDIYTDSTTADILIVVSTIIVSDFWFIPIVYTP